MREAEPQPVGVAGFVLKMPVQDGSRRRLMADWDFVPAIHPLRVRDSWPVEVPPYLGATTKSLQAAVAAAPPAPGAELSCASLFRSVRLPVYLPGSLGAWSGLPPLEVPRDLLRPEDAAAPQEQEWKSPAEALPGPGAQPILPPSSLWIGSAELSTSGDYSPPLPPPSTDWMQVPGPDS
ncbi:MAG TPA: hypothetical protein VGH38_26735, partial [Bryobacteraceae bacterium]